MKNYIFLGKKYKEQDVLKKVEKEINDLILKNMDMLSLYESVTAEMKSYPQLEIPKEEMNVLFQNETFSRKLFTNECEKVRESLKDSFKNLKENIEIAEGYICQIPKVLEEYDSNLQKIVETSVPNELKLMVLDFDKFILKENLNKLEMEKQFLDERINLINEENENE